MTGLDDATLHCRGVDARASLPDSLRRQLPGWLREIPLYRQRQPVPPAAELASEFFRLPLITKRDIRTGFPQNFLRDGVELDDLLESDAVELEHTAGTSEERTPLILGRQWWAEQESRALRLNPFVAGVLDEFPEARRVTINSPMCSGDIRYSGTVTRSDRIVGRTLFTCLSRLPFLWGEADLARMVAEGVEWNPVFLDVDPVYGALFALECERRGIRFPSLQFVLASYEFVSAAHRRILERAFHVPVFNLYGSTETGHLLMETEQGRLRASSETAYLELLNCDETRIGDLVQVGIIARFKGEAYSPVDERPHSSQLTQVPRIADREPELGSIGRKDLQETGPLCLPDFRGQTFGLDAEKLGVRAPNEFGSFGSHTLQHAFSNKVMQGHSPFQAGDLLNHAPSLKSPEDAPIEVEPSRKLRKQALGHRHGNGSKNLKRASLILRGRREGVRNNAGC